MLFFGVMFPGREWFRLAAVLLLVGGSLRAEMPNLKGTMPEDYLPGLMNLLENAGRQAPEVLLKQIELEQADAQVMAARARLLPSVGSDFNYAISQSAISGASQSKSTSDGFFYNVSAGQPIFYWGELWRSFDIAQLRETMSQRGFAETRRRLFVLLRRLYLELVASKAALIHAQTLLDLNQQQIDAAEARLKEGDATQLEVNSRRQEMKGRQLQFDKARDEYDRARRAVGRIAGVGELPDADVAPQIPKPVSLLETGALVVAETLRRGGKNTYTAEIAEMRVREADLTYRIRKVGLLPKFGVTVAHSLENSTNVSQSAVSQTGISRESISIGGRWPIFDGGATRAAKKDALAAKRIAERQLQTVAETTVEEVFNQQKAVEFAWRDLEFSEESLSFSGVMARRIQEDVDASRTPRSAIANARRDQLLAEARAAKARADFYVAWSNLVSLAGADPLTNAGSPNRHGR